jgi:hypothetical protein
MELKKDLVLQMQPLKMVTLELSLVSEFISLTTFLLTTVTLEERE